MVGDNDERRQTGARRGSKIRLLELLESDLAHGVEGQLPLLGASFLKPGKTLPHLLKSCAQPRLQGFID
jgi:hypothetical protein